MIRRLSLALGLAALFAAPAAAQIPLVDARVGVHAIMPTGDLADDYKGGYGAYGRLGISLGLIKLMGTMTYNMLPGKTIDVLGSPVGLDDETVLGISFGPHISAPMLDVGLEFAYLSNFEEMGFIPSVSLGLGKLDVMASYTIVNTDPKLNWLGLGVGLRF